MSAIPMISVAVPKNLYELVKEDKDGKLIVLYHLIDLKSGVEQIAQIRQCLYFQKGGDIIDYTFNKDLDGYIKEILQDYTSASIKSMHDAINVRLQEG